MSTANSRKRSTGGRKASRKGPGNVVQPKNEFSRPLSADKVLGGASGRTRFRQLEASVVATEGEREALAKRFSLKQIQKLEAEITLGPEPRQMRSRMNRSGGGGGGEIQVDGTVFASVTQTCVRTREEFDLDLEIPLSTVLRPAVAIDDNEEDVHEPSYADLDQGSSYPKEKPKDRKKVRLPQRKISEMDLTHLQELLTNFDEGDEDEVIEDENIYTTKGIIDVGELVSQSLLLTLDPLPQKPGLEDEEDDDDDDDDDELTFYFDDDEFDLEDLDNDDDEPQLVYSITG